MYHAYMRLSIVGTEMGSRILLLEDEPLIAMMLGDWISDLGHEVRGPCKDVAAALAIVDGGSPVDAALLDVKLGEDDCYGVAEALRRRNVPFAFMTGESGDRLDDRFATASVLPKPFDFDTMQRELDRLLRVDRAQDAQRAKASAQA